MAATIKPIEGRSVIVDLCSVVKELVENSLDAGANVIDVRFKNQGLDLIEVQDNGSGICPANYPSIALKHHTSKLSSYSDIASLTTFGFRGEALASLCALSVVTITTCLESDVPKGCKLDFEISGKLASTTVVASQKGTTVSVEKLFHNLPVRRRELERNIKREWHKVIALLNQYACIQTNLKFSVFQQPTKGKRILLFSTKNNPTTRENIINIFGSKAMSTLVSLDLLLEMHSPNAGRDLRGILQIDKESRQVRVLGHVSRPMHEDGKQAPDRQMFFVNGRPCCLPQFAKTFNEVYKNYNMSRSPFIFANIQLDTNTYDVNVSPDKRSILLHDQSMLLDRLRSSLVSLFDSHEYQLPTTQSLAPETRSNPVSVGTDMQSVSLFRENRLRVSKPELSTVSHGEQDSHSRSKLNADLTKEKSSGVAIQKAQSSSEGRARTNITSGSLTTWLENVANPPSISNSADRNAHFERNQPNISSLTSNRRPALNDSDTEGPPQSESTRSVFAEADTVPKKGVVEDHGTNSHNVSEGLLDSRSPAAPSRNANSGVTSPSSGHTNEHGESVRLGLEKRRHEGVAPQTPEKSYSSHPQISNRTTELSDFCELQGGIAQLTYTSEPNNAGDAILGDSFHSQEMAKGITDNLQDARLVVSSSSKPQTNEDKPIRQFISHQNDKDNVAQGDNNESPGRLSSRRTRVLEAGLRNKFATVQHSQIIRATEITLASLSRSLLASLVENIPGSVEERVADITAPDAESKLPLIIAKDDFSKMRVVGQFNLGFIIAVRPKSHWHACHEIGDTDELFIIDQHASDEKFNFERLQADTVIQSQRLVYPKTLQLTALEEEVVLENLPALEANGFKIQVDSTGASITTHSQTIESAENVRNEGMSEQYHDW
ncbi:Post Meiotic Segregation 2 [Metarhizium album ARSEF 1941]|uniref:Post Meiotic Segregation 2 n=1 Tax=Metarhizium album (strain ARSEF 1941) TaxID=1081103 RepID=A0A0B2WWQ8_METAS|nr:Post Meiotic Segregation 2 [Metarhizium album ARSEF 1941]KHN97857.1 Post Meiotic Segregation 2 [Metarhizium album ARSEF 1941]